VDSQFPGDLRDRLTGLPDQPHRALLEVLIELPACLRHRPSSKGDVSTVRGETHPALLTRIGIGPDNAAALIAAGDNPDRLGSEASFAALCGVSPLEASSGRTSRRRLNRGGDRQANSAHYRIALCRLRWDARTRDYLARRITEGKTHREAIRCLKRYIAREIYRIITSPPETQPSAA
jgi:transposase